MEYKFNDYDGRLVTVKKAIIVLSKRGDVNLDKKSNTEDAKYISERYRNRLPFEALAYHLLPSLFICVSMLAGHLFMLTDSLGSNLFFICALAGLLLLFWPSEYYRGR